MYVPDTTTRPARRRPEAKCPVRAGEPCTLCWPGASGPLDCGLVYLVKDDPELGELRAEMLRKQKQGS